MPNDFKLEGLENASPEIKDKLINLMVFLTDLTSYPLYHRYQDVLEHYLGKYRKSQSGIPNITIEDYHEFFKILVQTKNGFEKDKNKYINSNQDIREVPNYCLFVKIHFYFLWQELNVNKKEDKSIDITEDEFYFLFIMCREHVKRTCTVKPKNDMEMAEKTSKVTIFKHARRMAVISENFYLDHYDELVPFTNVLKRKNDCLKASNIKLYNELTEKRTALTPTKETRLGKHDGVFDLKAKNYKFEDICSHPTAFGLSEYFVMPHKQLQGYTLPTPERFAFYKLNFPTSSSKSLNSEFFNKVANHKDAAKFKTTILSCIPSSTNIFGSYFNAYTNFFSCDPDQFYKEVKVIEFASDSSTKLNSVVRSIFLFGDMLTPVDVSFWSKNYLKDLNGLPNAFINFLKFFSRIEYISGGSDLTQRYNFNSSYINKFLEFRNNTTSFETSLVGTDFKKEEKLRNNREKLDHAVELIMFREAEIQNKSESSPNFHVAGTLAKLKLLLALLYTSPTSIFRFMLLDPNAADKANFFGRLAFVFDTFTKFRERSKCSKRFAFFNPVMILVPFLLNKKFRESEYVVYDDSGKSSFNEDLMNSKIAEFEEIFQTLRSPDIYEKTKKFFNSEDLLKFIAGKHKDSINEFSIEEWNDLIETVKSIEL